MRKLFLDARVKERFELKKSIIPKLPKDLVIAASIQYLDSLPRIVEQLSTAGITTSPFKGSHSLFPGQILGCDLVKIPKPLLFIGEGDFHPLTISFSSEVDVYCYNVVTQKLKLMDKKKIERIKKRKQGALLKFYHSTTIGVIISTKPGQNYMDLALKLTAQYNDKEFVYFLCDKTDFNEMENYPFIEVWVNTSCPRLGWDDTVRTVKPLLDLRDIL